MTPLHYLFLGYALIWLGLGTYLFRLGGRIARVQRDVDELKERLRRG
jgi:CcmD family protein